MNGQFPGPSAASNTQALALGDSNPDGGKPVPRIDSTVAIPYCRKVCSIHWQWLIRQAGERWITFRFWPFFANNGTFCAAPPGVSRSFYLAKRSTGKGFSFTQGKTDIYLPAHVVSFMISVSTTCLKFPFLVDLEALPKRLWLTTSRLSGRWNNNSGK